MNLILGMRSERDLERLLELLRAWQRACDGASSIQGVLVGSVRSREELDALLRRVGMRDAAIEVELGALPPWAKGGTIH